MSCKTGGTYRYHCSVNVNHGSCLPDCYVSVMCVLFTPFRFAVRLFTADILDEAAIRTAKFQIAWQNVLSEVLNFSKLYNDPNWGQNKVKQINFTKTLSTVDDWSRVENQTRCVLRNSCYGIGVFVYMMDKRWFDNMFSTSIWIWESELRQEFFRSYVWMKRGLLVTSVCNLCAMGRRSVWA